MRTGGDGGGGGGSEAEMGRGARIVSYGGEGAIFGLSCYS